MNRVQLAIDRQATSIAQKVASKAITANRLIELSQNLDIQFDEFFVFQERKSLAFAQGKLTLDEANLVYQLLGSSTEHFNAQPLAVKVVLTTLFAELLKEGANA